MFQSGQFVIEGSWSILLPCSQEANADCSNEEEHSTFAKNIDIGQLQNEKK